MGLKLGPSALSDNSHLRHSEKNRRLGESESVIEYTARARKVYGGWEVTVAGVPNATFIHRDPTEDIVRERLAMALDRLDFEVTVVRDVESFAQ